MTKHQINTVEELCQLWGCDRSELVGQTFRECLEAADSAPGVQVFWGCWNTKQLDSVIV